MSEEKIFSPSGDFTVKATKRKPVSRKNGSTGKRSLSNDDGRTGRYVGATQPRGKVSKLAVDATLRAAAPHQLERRRESGIGNGIHLRIDDIREKVLSRSSGSSILFALDASGSMGTDRVMSQAKGIVLSLLGDAYQKRDRVGVLAFRGTEAKLILPFTTSVELADERLRHVATGGKSPLGLALAKAGALFEREMKQNPGRTPILVLLTDGRANISMSDGDPFDETLRVARKIKRAKVRSLVVDTDLTWIHSYPYARDVALALGGKRLRLDQLEVRRIIEFVDG